VYPLGGTFAVLRPHLPRALVSDAAFARLVALGHGIPAALTRFAYVECRLAAHDDAVDTVLSVMPEERAQVQAAASHSVGRGWARAAALCERWDAAGPHAALDHLWLELDAATEPSDPGVFLSFGDVPRMDRVPATATGAADAALEALLGAPLPPLHAAHLRRAIDALPAGAYVPYYGVMFGRSDRAVRLCAIGLDDVAIATWLWKLRWPGDVDALGRLLGDLGAVWAEGSTHLRRMVHVDVTDDGLGPRAGVEYGLAPSPQLRGQIAERPFLDTLVTRGWCTPEKRDALLAWPGYSAEHFPHEPWRSLLVRRLNHVKIVHRPDAPPQAKAYLAFLDTMLPRARTVSRAARSEATLHE